MNFNGTTTTKSHTHKGEFASRITEQLAVTQILPCAKKRKKEREASIQLEFYLFVLAVAVVLLYVLTLYIYTLYYCRQSV